MDQGRSMKPELDTGVEVYDNKVKKKQRHATNEKQNMYITLLVRDQLLICITSISIPNTDLHQGKEETTPHNKRKTKYIFKYT